MHAAGFDLYNHQKLMDEADTAAIRRIDERQWDQYEERRVRDVDHFTLCAVLGKLKKEQQFGLPIDESVIPEPNNHTYITDGKVYLEVAFEDFLQTSELLPAIIDEERQVRLFGQLELDNIFYVEHFEHLVAGCMIPHDFEETTAELDRELSVAAFAAQTTFPPGAYLLLLFEHDFYGDELDRCERLVSFLTTRQSASLDQLFASAVLVIHGMNTHSKEGFQSIGNIDPLQRFIDRILATNRFMRICLIPSAATDLYDSIPMRFHPSLSSCSQQTTVVLSSKHLSFNSSHRRTDYHLSSSKTSRPYFSRNQLNLLPSTLCLLSFDARLCYSIYY